MGVGGSGVLVGGWKVGGITLVSVGATVLNRGSTVRLGNGSDAGVFVGGTGVQVGIGVSVLVGGISVLVGVGVDVAVLVGGWTVGFLGVLVGVGDTSRAITSDSNAPISQPLPTGRVTPR